MSGPVWVEKDMNNRILCIAPHSDDETLGCGGTLLRHIAEGDEVYWCIVTEAKPPVITQTDVKRRAAQIQAVAEYYGFSETHSLGFPAASLSELPERDIIEALKSMMTDIDPGVIYLNNGTDAHSDHAIVFRTAMSALKPFRTGKAVRRILTYETISETEQAPGKAFSPNVFTDITETIEGKLDAFAHYQTEIQACPLPREATAIRALARFRGATIAVEYAEAFMLIREVL